MSRTLKIKHDKLYEILRKKEDLIKEGRKISKEIEERDTERNKLGLKIQKLKERAIKFVDAEKVELGEFEYIHSIDHKGEEVELTINDKIEEVKEAIREQKKEQAKQ